MNKKAFTILLLFIFSLLFISHAFAVENDTAVVPGKVGEVIDCGEDIKIRFMANPIYSFSIFQRMAKSAFIRVDVMLEYIGDENWDGLDKTSFELVNLVDMDKTYPLDYTTTVVTSKMYQVSILPDDLEFPARNKYYLVFDVDWIKSNWLLHFAPKERGSEAPVCDLMLPLPHIVDSTVTETE